MTHASGLEVQCLKSIRLGVILLKNVFPIRIDVVASNVIIYESNQSLPLRRILHIERNTEKLINPPTLWLDFNTMISFLIELYRSLWRSIQAWKMWCWAKVSWCLFHFQFNRYEQCSAVYATYEYNPEKLENSNTPTSSTFTNSIGRKNRLFCCCCHIKVLTSSQCICVVVPFDSI